MGFEFGEFLEGHLVEELVKFGGEGRQGRGGFCGSGALFFWGAEKIFDGDAEIVGD